MKASKRGDRSDQVAEIHTRLLSLGFEVDAEEIARHDFGPSTEAAIRTFQQERGLLVDAVVGPGTWEELIEAGFALGDRSLYLRIPAFRGDDVRTLQTRLDLLGFDPGRADGIFGERTRKAVQDFQRNVGLDPDAIVGPTTIDSLNRLRPPLPGPGRTTVRETESMRDSTPLAGRTIALDAGHGPEDPGGVGPAGLTEGEATFGLVTALADELRSSGARAIFLRERTEDPPADERVKRANASEADIVVSLHLNTHTDPSAEGSSSYYFGRMGAASVPGKALAELVQEALTTQLGLRDGRTHPKAFPLLRETPMPAVQVEPCFLSNPKEERLLREPEFRRGVARALVSALERFFVGEANDPNAES